VRRPGTSAQFSSVAQLLAGGVRRYCVCLQAAVLDAGAIDSSRHSRTAIGKSGRVDASALPRTSPKPTARQAGCGRVNARAGSREVRLLRLGAKGWSGDNSRRSSGFGPASVAPAW
jgi:hypothetical protein